MIKLAFCLTRLPGLTPEQFRQHWREVHGPLVRKHAQALRIRRYVQCHTAGGELTAALRRFRGAPEPFDGIAELWFDSEEEMRASGRDPAGREAARALIEDERRFVDHARSPIFLVREEAIVAASG